MVFHGCGMRTLDLFSGIGGFALGLEATGGFETAAFCEQDGYARRILRKHWPDVWLYEDVRILTARRLKQDGIGKIDCIAGGFPCQDISTAGKGIGIEGARSGLWSEFARLIGECRPAWIVAHTQQLRWKPCEIERADCQVEKAPKGKARARHSAAIRADNCGTDVADTNREPPIRPSVAWEECNPWATEPQLGRVADGIPDRMDRLRCLGNAVVPQVVAMIGNAILKAIADGVVV